MLFSVFDRPLKSENICSFFTNGVFVETLSANVRSIQTGTVLRDLARDRLKWRRIGPDDIEALKGVSWE
jgi:hypothetical protein